MFAIFRALLTAMGLVALAVAVCALVVLWAPISSHFLLVATVASPYLMLAAPLALVLFLACRRWVMTAAAAAVTGIALAVQLPWYHVADKSVAGEHVEIRVLSANLRLGQADPQALIRLARGVDLISVQELTATEAKRLSEAGLSTLFPYSVLKPDAGAGGIGLWSRYPLAAIPQQGRPGVAVVSARLHVPGLRINPTFAALHITAPYPRPLGSWQQGIAGTQAVLQQLKNANRDGAVIVAGDFNATPEMREFRGLLTNGYRDASEQTGAGFAPTFPADRWYMSLLTIDHVLTRNAAATSVDSVSNPGSDHRGLIVTIQVPTDSQEPDATN